MTVKPTMRDKRRYVSFRVEVEGGAGEREIREGVLSTLLTYLGELGFSKAGPRIAYFKPSKGLGIIKCSVESVNEVRAGLALVSKIGGRKAAVRLLGNSGSICKLKGEEE